MKENDTHLKSIWEIGSNLRGEFFFIKVSFKIINEVTWSLYINHTLMKNTMYVETKIMLLPRNRFHTGINFPCGVCVRASVRACERASVRACERACVRACVCV